jgi:hypothetical protein
MTLQPRQATVLNDYRQALIAAAHTLWDVDQPELFIADGHPGVTQVDDIVGFGHATSTQDSGPYGPRRQREETMTLTVLFSIYRLGGIEAEKAARDYAYDRLRELENYVRATNTELGGVVRDCFITGIDDAAVTDPKILARGRLVEVQAELTAHARITS